MDKPIVVNYWCVASLFLAIAIVAFLLFHPMNAPSLLGGGPTASLFSAIISP